MKKVIFLFAFSILFGEACKKKDTEMDPNTFGYSDDAPHAYIKGVVYDSTTLLPITSACIYKNQGLSYSPNLTFTISDTSLLDGNYFTIFWWGGKYYPPKPSDSTDIYIRAVTSNKTGYAHFKAASLINKDTITYNIYIVPIAYMKVHIKNTGTISGCNVF